jgi:glutamine amidotransferase-like uncharacterized protein
MTVLHVKDNMKPRIALFIHQPKCSVQSGNGIIKALSSNYDFKIFTRHEVESDFFDDVDCICFPGGIGDSDSFEYLLEYNGDRIRQYVLNGGKYLGICMGAYWTGKSYFNFLEDIDVVQYIKRPDACTKRPHAKSLKVTWKDNPEWMFFYDGCSMLGDETKFKTVARYSNNDPMAIIKDNIGLIGCHPESEEHWYKSYTWLRGFYHDGDHHRLLLNFVDELMERK